MSIDLTAAALRVRRFRDLFLGCVDEPSAHSAEELVRSKRHAHLVYLPSESILSAPHLSPGEDVLNAVDRVCRQWNAADLYQRALAVPPSPMAREPIEAALSQAQLTVIVFPGIFGEFVTVLPFDEVAGNGSSAYAREWQRLLQRRRDGQFTAQSDDVLWEEHFSLASLSLDPAKRPEVRRPLEDMFEVASIDDMAGNVLLRVIVFRHHPDSLETLGSLGDITAVVSHRLAKLFAVTGVPTNIVLLGYSMGACVALDVAAKEYGAGEKWVQNLRAVVAVGGVVLGSHLADVARLPANGKEHSLHRQVRLLEELAAALEETTSYPILALTKRRTKLGVWWRNLLLWRRFWPEIRALLKDHAPGEEAVSVPTVLKLLARSDFSPTLALAWGIATRTLHLYDPRHYSLNIRKFKRLVAAILAGIDNLTTRSRREWWQRVTLPTEGVRYYAIAATMPGEAIDVNGKPLVENADAYAFPSLDLLFLQQSYRDYSAVSGQRLNDSQVAVSRAQFWPELLPILNPYYGRHRLAASLLGVVGVHHWGLALAEVNHLKGDLKNPFPRAALLKALGAQVAFDLIAGP